MTMPRTLAFLAIGLLTVAGVATVVAAQDGQGKGGHAPPSDHQGPPPGEAMREKAKAQAVRDRIGDLRAHLQELCGDDNATAALNDSEQALCDKVGQFHDKALKARREAHALIGALDALERRIGRMTIRIHVLQAELASGNFTGNDTAESVQAEINATQAHQDQMVDRVLHLRDRLDALHAKWEAVREHVADERHHGALGDPADVPSDDGPDASGSDSATETTSASSTSSAAA